MGLDNHCRTGIEERQEQSMNAKAGGWWFDENRVLLNYQNNST